MHILLIAATEPELLPIADYLQERGYKIWNHRIQLSVTGVGLTSTAYFLTRLICETKPDLIIQAGIAGSFEPFDKPKVIAVTEDRFADMGVLENNRFIDVFSLQLVEGNKNPFIKGSLVNPYQQLLMLASCESGRAISVNEVSTNKERIAWYQQNYSPVVESMEGAAFHFVCLLEKIPFLQLRAVSNYIGERNKKNWKIGEAIENLNHQLILLLEKLGDHNEIDFRI